MISFRWRHRQAQPFLVTICLMLAIFAIVKAGIGLPARAADEVNIYSYREPGLVKPLIDAFTAETGIKVNMIFSKSGLIERVKAEGTNSPADVLLTNEFGLLTQAKAAGITSSIHSETLNRAIPANLRDSAGHWFGLTRRARVVYASIERVSQDTIDYEDLADPKWKGRICTRSGQHTYNVALFASMIVHHGKENAKAWLSGLKDNLARKPAGGDREGVRDVYSGLCDLAVGNTYYMAAMMRNPKQKAWAQSVKILFPNAGNRGTHVNISGAALVKFAPHSQNGIRFVEFLASQAAQRIYAETISEYPVVAGVPVSDIVNSWGSLKADPVPLEKIDELRAEASRLVDEVNYNSGPSS